MPDLPQELRTGCKDPGVPGIETVAQAVDTIGQTRIYAACSVRKQQDTVKFYDNVKEGFAG